MTVPQDLRKGCSYSLQAASETLDMMFPAHLCTLFPSLPSSVLPSFQVCPRWYYRPSSPALATASKHWRGNAAPCHPEQQPSSNPCWKSCAAQRLKPGCFPTKCMSILPTANKNLLLPLEVDQNSNLPLFSCCLCTGLLSPAICLGTCCISISSVP